MGSCFGGSLMISFVHTLVLVIVGIVQMAVEGAFILIIFNKKLEWKKLLLFAVINGLASMLLRTLPVKYIAILNIAVYFGLMILTLKLILKLRLFQSILGVFLAFLAGVPIENINVTILKLYLQDRFDSFIGSQSFTLFMVLQNMGTFFYLLFTLVIYYLKMRIDIPEDLGRKRTLGIIVNLLIVCTFILPNILFFYTTVSKMPESLMWFNMITAFALMLLGFYNTIKHNELEVGKREIEFQKLNIKNLEDIVDGLRGFKHDFNNIVQVIGGYLSLNDIEGLKAYYKQMQRDSVMINNKFPVNAYLKNNPALYGLVLSKFTYSEVKNVSFVVNILQEFRVPPALLYDLCKVVGILLDNAIEAASESEKKHVELYIKHNAYKNILDIEITNSFSGDIDRQRIFEDGFTTKEGHTGFGLWEVKKILAKHKNCALHTVVGQNVFTQKIELST